MGEIVYESKRTFQLWRYTVSHSQLLLRSAKSDGETMRIDLLFKAVKAMNLIPNLKGLRVEKAHPAADAFADMEPGDCCYEISSGSFRGYVVAGGFWQASDDREFFEPSPFAGSLMEDL